MSTAAAHQEYVSGTQATKLLGWNWHRLLRAAMDGDIRAKKLPGGRDPRYSLEDINRIRGELGGGDMPKAG